MEQVNYMKRTQVLPNSLKPGTMMIRDGLLLAELPNLDTSPHSKGWRSVTALDSSSLGRKLDTVGLHLFFLAGQVATVAFGFGGEQSLRKAVQRVAAKVKALDLNCLELTEIAKKHFLGLPYIAISAHSCHIQPGCMLQSVEERRAHAAQ
jgi:hypothetical protein